MSSLESLSSMKHGFTQGKNEALLDAEFDAEFLAQQKLYELQANTIAIEDVTEKHVINYQNVNYSLTWDVSGTTPVLAVVRVTWKQDGKTHMTEIAEYIDQSREADQATPSVINIIEENDQSMANDIAIRSHVTAPNPSM